LIEKREFFNLIWFSFKVFFEVLKSKLYSRFLLRILWTKSFLEGEYCGQKNVKSI